MKYTGYIAIINRSGQIEEVPIYGKVSHNRCMISSMLHAYDTKLNLDAESDVVQLSDRISIQIIKSKDSIK